MDEAPGENATLEQNLPDTPFPSPAPEKTQRDWRSVGIYLVRRLVQGRSPEHHTATTLLVGPLAVGLGLLYAAILFSASLDFRPGHTPSTTDVGPDIGRGTAFYVTG